jgi:peroxiredoxin
MKKVRRTAIFPLKSLSFGASSPLVIILTVCLLIIAFVIGSYQWSIKQQNQDASSSSTSLRSAPKFELPDHAGVLHRLGEFQGSVVVLHFWASWCAPCLDEIPQWVELATAFKDRPLKLVGISLDQKWEDALKILPQRDSKNLVSLLDTSGKIPDEYGTYQFPETYLLNRDSKIIMKWVGPQDWSSQTIHEVISKALTSNNL